MVSNEKVFSMKNHRIIEMVNFYLHHPNPKSYAKAISGIRRCTGRLQDDQIIWLGSRTSGPSLEEKSGDGFIRIGPDGGPDKKSEDRFFRLKAEHSGLLPERRGKHAKTHVFLVQMLEHRQMGAFVDPKLHTLRREPVWMQGGYGLP